MQFTQDQKSGIRHKLVLAARDDKSDFDETILKNFKAESFDVSYLPLANVESQHESIEALRRLAGELGDGENFAIVGPSFSSPYHQSSENSD